MSDTVKDTHLHLEESVPSSSPKRRWGLVAVALTGSIAIGLTVVTYPFISPAFRKICLPYVPATNRQLENIFRLCRNSGSTLVDLGSGDGRVVFAASQRGFKATGVELNPWLVGYSIVKSLFLRVHHRARFYRRDIFKVNFALYDNIVVFGVPDLMPPLKMKMQQEMNANAVVIACRFPLPDCKPSQTIDEGIDSVWLYQKTDISKDVHL